MFRTCLSIFIVSLGLTFQGCAAFEYLDGSSKEDIRRFKTPKQKTQSELDQSKIENVKLKREVEILKKENQKIKDTNLHEIIKMRDQNSLLNEQIDCLKKEKRVLTTKIDGLEKKHETLSRESRELGRDIGKLKIKVLSGDGDLNSAKEMKKKLLALGYKIKFIQPAPRFNFKQNTVYFASAFQTEAKELASKLGDKTILKPLTWNSVYDLIVVTGKNR